MASEHPPGRGRTALLLAAPMLLAVAAYARVLHGDFQLDDAVTVQSPAPVDWNALRLPGSAGRPLTALSFELNRASGRLDPWGFHVTNLVLHLAVVLLVFAFTRRVLRLAGAARTDGSAVLVAGLFALHPLQSQAVSYVSQRSEVLASGLYLAAILLLLESELRRRGAVRLLAYASALAAMGLALLAKEIAVTAPLAYLMVAAMAPDEDGRRRLRTWRTRLLLVAPFIVLAGSASLATLRGLSGRADAGFGVRGSPAGSYLLTQLRVHLTYLRLLFWPSGQNVDWDYPPSRSLAEPATLGAAAVLLALVAGAATTYWWSRRRWTHDGAAGRVAALGALWFLVLLSPTSSVVPLADAVMEHRVYLASWGVFVAAAVAGERLLSRLPWTQGRVRAGAIVAFIWVVLGLVLYQRNAVWETQLALWSDAVAKSPRKARPHFALGFAHQGRGDHEAAIREYRTALELVSWDYVDTKVQILRNLGAALLHAGRADEAIAALQLAAGREPRNPEVLGNLAIAMLVKRDLASAEGYALRAVEASPEGGRPLWVLGTVRLEQGDAAGAVALLERAVRDDPGDGGRRVQLGIAYARLGRAGDACAAWRQALQLRVDPGLREQTAQALRGCPGR